MTNNNTREENMSSNNNLMTIMVVLVTLILLVLAIGLVVFIYEISDLKEKCCGTVRIDDEPVGSPAELGALQIRVVELKMDLQTIIDDCCPARPPEEHGTSTNGGRPGTDVDPEEIIEQILIDIDYVKSLIEYINEECCPDRPPEEPGSSTNGGRPGTEGSMQERIRQLHEVIVSLEAEVSRLWEECCP